VEKVKRGRIVAVRDPKTIEVLMLRVGYVRDRFGKLLRQDIKRPDVLAFMRFYEAEGKLETRDRVRSIDEQICNYADVEGDGHNPFRNLNGPVLVELLLGARVFAFLEQIFCLVALENVPSLPLPQGPMEYVF
jgi:hypothetical protein